MYSKTSLQCKRNVAAGGRWQGQSLKPPVIRSNLATVISSVVMKVEIVKKAWKVIQVISVESMNIFEHVEGAPFHLYGADRRRNLNPWSMLPGLRTSFDTRLVAVGRVGEVAVV